jgi:two-component system chemotaxis sensor kinase CheA
MDDFDQVALFVREAEDLLGSLESGLLTMESGSCDRDEINALFRAAHTIKGNAGIIGASGCAHFTHLVENVLARMRDGALASDPAVVGALLDSVDALRELVRVIGAEGGNPEVTGRDELLAVLAELTSLDAAPAQPAAEAERGFRIVLNIPADEPMATLRGLIDEIAALGALVSIEPALTNDEAREFRMELRGALRKADIAGLVLFSNASIAIETMETVAQDVRRAPSVVSSAPATATTATATTTIATAKAVSKHVPSATSAGRTKSSTAVKVDSERLDRLLEQVGELAIALGLVRHRAEDGTGSRRQQLEALEGVDRLVSEVHERVMSLRMAPVKDTFERMRRPVRDAARQLGKEVTVQLEGLDTELDRKLLDELADPLTHMVRNSVAHGIESPAARRAAGKPTTGRVTLRAMHRNGAAVIEVEDDGGGIDPEKVRERAVERNLVSAGAKLSEEEIYALLFAPGFSTAEAVNQIAGRGVGLDVVVNSVERLQGRVEISSQVGQGSTFRIRLPLTLAVLDGMNVRVGAETVSIPMREVEELLDPALTIVRTLEGKAEYVEVRGELLPAVRLGQLLHLASRSSECQGDASVVVVKSDKRRFAILVDRIVGMNRTVVKSLDRTFELLAGAEPSVKRSAGIGGATILGDGSVGYVLDVHGLDGLAFG